MRRARGFLAAILAAAVLAPAPARGQELLAGAVGGAIGLGAGGYVALGIVALKARHGDYLYGVEDVFGWESAAVIGGITTGVVLGLWDQERLRRATYAAAGGAAIGTVVGALVGRRLWSPPEGKWAGGVIGGGAGILIGAGLGALWPVDDGSQPAQPVAFAVSIPLGR